MFTKRMAAAVMAVIGVAGGAGAQTVIQGPVYNAATGHRYYVVQSPNWNVSAAFAQAMGGRLATVNDAAEGAWIFANLTAGGTRKLFIGLNDAAVEGTFVWASGENSSYRAWGPGEPSNLDYVCIQTDGLWYARADLYVPFAVVEISGPIHVPAEMSFGGAMAAVSSGVGTREIEVAPGTYTLTEFAAGSSPAGTTTTVRGAGAGQTVIVGPPTNSTMSAAGNWDFTGIEFRFSAGSVQPGIELVNGLMSFDRCVFAGTPGARVSRALDLANEASVSLTACSFRDLGVPISYRFSENTVIASNCEFTRSSVAAQASTSIAPTFIAYNCTFADIAHATFNCFEGPSARFTLANSIVWNINLPITNGRLVARSCDIQGGYAGPGNISVYPQFASSTSYQLLSNSPCIDAGSVDLYRGSLTDMLGNARVVDVRAVTNTGASGAIDMGCYEAVDPFACRSDFNGDGVTNSGDFFEFLSSFFTCQ